jgi:aminopeptidase N
VRDVLALPPPKPPDPTERLSVLGDNIAAAFEFLASHFGPPALPTLMVSPIPGTFGQGFPGLVYISTLSYLDPKDRPVSARDAQNELFFSELLQTHETAHQWWGNVVFPASAQDEWLLEGLANYSALLYLEKHKGARAMNTVLERYKEALLAKNDSDKELESAGPIRLGGRLQSSLSPGAWRSIIYGKGTWILHMLRRRLGDESFLKLLGELCRRYHFQAVSVAEFQQMAASYLPKGAPDTKLEHFFEHWVESVGIPEITMTTSVKGKTPRVALTISVQHSGIDEKTTLVVPVQVQLARGRSQTHWIMAGHDPMSVTLTLPSAPSKVTLDPEYGLLRR